MTFAVHPQQSEQIEMIAAALCKAQGEIDRADKNAEGQVGSVKRRYADLGSVLDACQKPLQDNGLAILQRPQPCENGVLLCTTLVHTSGQWISDGGLLIPSAKKDAQAFGSALTYARRYSMAAMLGIVQADDDGSGASRGGAAEVEKLSPEQNKQLVETLMASGMAEATAKARANVCPAPQFESWLSRAQTLANERVEAGA